MNSYVIYGLLIVVCLIILFMGIKDRKKPKIILSIFATALISMMIYFEFEDEKANKLSEEIELKKIQAEEKEKEDEQKVIKPKNEDVVEKDNNSLLPNIYETIGEGEKISSVSIEAKTLIIKVDFTNANPAPLTMEDLIDSRVSSISEGALENSKISDEWDNLKIDFGNYGYIVLDKSLVKDDGYGPYFTYPDGKMRFELQK